MKSNRVMAWMQKDVNRYGVLAFLISFFTAMMIFLPIMIQNEGILTLCNDFNLQQIPLNMLSNRAIKAGEIGWTWNVDLGSDFIGATSFYVTGSPFFYLSLLFPATLYPKLVGWIFMLKYAVAGLTAYVYIAQYCKDKRYALVGSLLYAFSGFQATNMLFYHFHDVVAFFPLLLYGVDQLVEKQKRGILAFASFLCAFINFYFFVGEVVFLILYFIMKYWVTDRKQWRNFVVCLLEGILGVGMAMVIFLPSMAFNLQNPRASEFLPVDQWFDMNKRYLLHVLRAFMLPANTMMKESYVVAEDYSSWAAYLPMVGFVPALIFTWKNRKHWLSRTTFVFVLFSIIPILNSVFYFVTSNNYHRWFNMLILLMSTMTSVQLEGVVAGKEQAVKQRRTLTLAAFLMALVSVLLWIGSNWWDQNKFQVIFDADSFVWIMKVAIVGYLTMGVVQLLFANRKWHAYAFVVTIAAFSVITTQKLCLDYKSYHTMDVDYGNLEASHYYDRILAYVGMENPDEGYRFATMDNISNMVGEISGDAAFTSTVNGSIIELHDAISEGREVFTPFRDPGLNELFSAKYVIESEMEDGSIYMQSLRQEQKNFEGQEKVAEVSYGNHMDSVYELDNILPMGYTYDTYMTQSETETLSNEERRFLMLQTLIIPDEDEAVIAETLDHFTLEEAVLDWNELQPIWTTYHRAASEDFDREKNGFLSKMNVEEDTYAFYSVPFDTGWKAYVNGEETSIVKIHGLMAVKLTKGYNEIRFSYQNPYLIPGCVITIVSFAGWIWLVRTDRRKRKKQEQAV